MRTALALALSLPVAAAAAPAAAACFDAFVYEDTRVLLSVLPSTRERAALPDRDLASAYDAADRALVAFLDTELDRVCDDAKAAQIEVSSAIDDLVAKDVLEAGKCCTGWNTGTGGTGCTDTTEDTCPGDLFYCEEGPSGCF
jgi:hypothetical protein